MSGSGGATYLPMGENTFLVKAPFTALQLDSAQPEFFTNGDQLIRIGSAPHDLIVFERVSKHLRYKVLRTIFEECTIRPESELAQG
jgi:hypothetical protein